MDRSNSPMSNPSNVARGATTAVSWTSWELFRAYMSEDIPRETSTHTGDDLTRRGNICSRLARFRPSLTPAPVDDTTPGPRRRFINRTCGRAYRWRNFYRHRRFFISEETTRTRWTILFHISRDYLVGICVRASIKSRNRFKRNVYQHREEIKTKRKGYCLAYLEKKYDYLI